MGVAFHPQLLGCHTRLDPLQQTKAVLRLLTTGMTSRYLIADVCAACNEQLPGAVLPEAPEDTVFTTLIIPAHFRATQMVFGHKHRDEQECIQAMSDMVTWHAAAGVAHEAWTPLTNLRVMWCSSSSQQNKLYTTWYADRQLGPNIESRVDRDISKQSSANSVSFGLAVEGQQMHSKAGGHSQTKRQTDESTAREKRTCGLPF